MTDFENNQAPQQPYAPVQPQAPYQPAAPVAPYQAPVQQAPYAPVQSQQAPFQAPQQAQMPPANKAKSKLPIIIGAVAVIAVVVILAVTLLGGGSGYKKAVENVLDCMFNYNTDNIESLYPAVLWEEEADEANMDVDELIDELKDTMEDNKEWDEEYGRSTSYEIGEYEKMDKDDVEDLKEAITDNYDYIDEDDIGNKAYTVEVQYEVSYEEYPEDSYDDEMELCVIKIDGEWYVVDEDGWFFG